MYRINIKVVNISLAVLFLITLLFFSTQTVLAVSLQRSVQNYCANGTSCNATLNSTTAGNLLVIFGAWDWNGGSSVSDTQGNNWIALPTVLNGLTSSVFYYAANIKGGADTVTFTPINANNNSMALAVLEYEGILTVNPLQSSSQRAAPSTTNALSTTNFFVANSGDLIVGGVIDRAANAFTPGLGYTKQANNNFMLSVEDQLASSAGAYAVTGTIDTTDNRWNAHALVFTAASGGPTPTPTITPTPMPTVTPTPTPTPTSTVTPTPIPGNFLVVTPSGSGNRSGSDWNNALAGLPSTLIRGKTYYLADGAYQSYNFTTPNFGTSLIYIKKAISPDHGTDTGWNLSIMGSGQAIFGPGSSGNGSCFPWYNRDNGVGYYVLDGQVGSGEGVVPYGIKLDTSQCTTVSFTRGIELTNSSNVTVRNLEISGLCTNIPVSSYRASCDNITNNEAVESSAYIFGSNNITFEHLWMHDTANGGIDIGTTNNFVWQNSIITRLTYTQSQHTNCISAHGGTSSLTIRYNLIHDAEGSGCITSLNSGSPVTDSDWEIYGNIFYGTSGNPYARIYFQNGVIACINGNECPGWKIFNNSFVNLSTGNQNGVGWFNGATAAVKPTIQNNIWYNSVNANFVTIPSGYVEDYNIFLNSGIFGTGSHDIKNTSANNPFVNWPGGDFHLVSHTNDGLHLSSPYNLDPDGNTRGVDGIWDIGAYQYVSSTTTPIPGDLNLDHTVNSIDYSLMNAHWLQNYPTADINTDSLVNSLDFAILKSNWGRTW